MELLLIVAVCVGGGLLILRALIRSARRPVTRQTAGTRRRAYGSQRGRASRAQSDEDRANKQRQIALARQAQQARAVDFTAPAYEFNVVGESFYQDSLRRIAGKRLEAGETVVVPALVVPDYENPFSKSGRAVMVVLEGQPCGHFAEGDAEAYARVSEKLKADGCVGSCGAWLTGGADGRSIGVKLALRSPSECAEQLGLQPPGQRTRSAPAREPEYVNRECPYCAAALDPLPKRKKKCPKCSQLIAVRTDSQGRRHLLREDQVQAVMEQWAQDEEQAEKERRFEVQEMSEAERAQGVVFDAYGETLEVVGESRFRSALHRIVEATGLDANRADWTEVQRVAQLVPDEDCVRVNIDSSQVGFLSDDDAEEYADALQEFGERGRPFLVRATIVGKAGRYGVKLEDVPDPLDCDPEEHRVTAAAAAASDEALAAVAGEELTQVLKEACVRLGRNFEGSLTISAEEGRVDIKSPDLEDFNRAEPGRVLDETRARLKARLGWDVPVYLIEE